MDKEYGFPDNLMSIFGYERMNPQPKNKMFRSEKYKKWLRLKPCAVCGAYPPSEVMHQRILGNCGMGIKPPDNESLPGCKSCHQIEQNRGFFELWEKRSMNKFKTKQALRKHIKTECKRYYKEYRATSL